MAQKLTFHYDRIGDILYIDRVAPYAEQVSEELSESVVARFNPHTEEIENLEIRGYSSQLQRGELLELPIIAEMRRVV